MKISCIIVSFNVSGLLQRCLQSLGHSPHEIIVVDNASQDDSVRMVQQEFPHVRLVPLACNVGFSAAVNTGARLASGDALLLLNPDTCLQTSLDTMAQRLVAQPQAVALGFRQVDEHGRFQLAWGLWPTLFTELLRRGVQRALDANKQHIARAIDHAQPRAVAWVAGSSLLVRREAFEKIGGFDEKFFLYFEDIDFCLRLRHAGGEIIYDPTITVLHHRGQSAQTSLQNSRRAYRDSQKYFWRKHHNRWSAALVGAYADWRRS